MSQQFLFFFKKYFMVFKKLCFLSNFEKLCSLKGMDGDRKPEVFM